MRFDYKTYGETGRKIQLREENSDNREKLQESMANVEDHSKIVITNEEEIYEEIDEFLVENAPGEAASIDDINDALNDIKELRRIFKRAHREMKWVDEYDAQYKPRLDEQLKKITDYLVSAKSEKKKRLEQSENMKLNAVTAEKQLLEEKEATDKKIKVEEEQRIAVIKMTEIDEKISQIEKFCSEIEFESENDKTIENAADSEVLAFKDNFSSVDCMIADIREMRDNFETLVSSFVQRESVIKNLSDKYAKVGEIVSQYKAKVRSELQKRELEDFKLKSMAQLNIHVPKFSGTDPSVDIYSFQTKFLSEHVRLPKAKILYQLKEKYLVGPAREMVTLEEDLEEIWKTLKDAFGDPIVLLNNELASVNKLGPLDKIKNHHELATALAKLANAMENLSKTAATHCIDYELYNTHSEAVIYGIIGHERVDKFLDKCSEDDAKLSKEEEWKKLTEFLREEAKRRSKIALRLKPLENPKILEKKGGEKEEKRKEQKSYFSDESKGLRNSSTTSPAKLTNDGCMVCGGPDCENKAGEKDFEYVKCKKFRKMSHQERIDKLKKDRACFQCLKRGHKFNEECKKKEFCCGDDFHKKYKRTFHVLLCENHREEEENKKLLEKYNLSIFKTKNNIPLNFVAVTPVFKIEVSGADEGKERSVYMFQRVEIDGDLYNLFYDDGCDEMNVTKRATERLGSRASEVTPGPRFLRGVGGKILQSDHGLWKISLPLADGGEALMTGNCLEKITHKFPEYEFDGAVKEDILDYCKNNGINTDSFPLFPRKAGGEIDIMIGMAYRKYTPQTILRLPSGLELNESLFIGADGSRGVICGPHSCFTLAEDQHESDDEDTTFIASSTMEIKLGTKINPTMDLLGFKNENDVFKNENLGANAPNNELEKIVAIHEATETVGTCVDYRCVDCRQCDVCKAGGKIESISLQEEYEQSVIDKSISVDVEKCNSVAGLPFIYDPEKELKPNRDVAEQVFRCETKRLDKCRKSKEDII